MWSLSTNRIAFSGFSCLGYHIDLFFAFEERSKSTNTLLPLVILGRCALSLLSYWLFNSPEIKWSTYATRIWKRRFLLRISHGWGERWRWSTFVARVCRLADSHGNPDAESSGQHCTSPAIWFSSSTQRWSPLMCPGSQAQPALHRFQ